MHASATRQRKRSRAVAHQLASGKGIGHPAVQRMILPDEDDDNPGIFSSLSKLARKGYYIAKRKYRNYYDIPTDTTKLSDIALFLHVDYYDLEEHLENIGSTESFPDAENESKYLTRHLGNEDTTPYFGLVPRFLLAGVTDDMTDEQKMDSVFERFNEYPFRYTGGSATAIQGFLQKSGDCATLLYMFIYAVRAAGVNVTREQAQQTAYGNILAPGLPIHGRTTDGNLVDTNQWLFVNHYWFSFGGRTYDLLFRTPNAVNVATSNESRQYNGVSYRVFSNGHCVIPQMEFYKLNDIGEIPAQRGEGIARDSEDAIRQYIDEHLPNIQQGNGNNIQVVNENV